MTRADLTALLLLLAFNGLLYAAWWQAPAPATAVEIRAPDQPPQRLPLDRDRELRINGHDGVSILRIENGRVRFVDGPCRNRICVHSGWHAHAAATARLAHEARARADELEAAGTSHAAQTVARREAAAAASRAEQRTFDLEVSQRWGKRRT